MVEVPGGVTVGGAQGLGKGSVLVVPCGAEAPGSGEPVVKSVLY